MKTHESPIVLLVVSALLSSCSIIASSETSSSSSSSQGSTSSSPASSSSAGSSSSSSEPSSSSSQESSSSFSSSAEVPSSSSSQAPSIDDCVSTPLQDAYEELGYSSLYTDQNFRNGFRVTKNSTSAEGGPYHDKYLKHYKESTENPSWTMCQWGSQYDIYETGYTENTSDDGLTTQYVSSGKEIGGKVVPAKKFGFDSKDGSIYLELNAEVEYDAPRKSGEMWCHLLYEQDFSSNLVQLSSLSSLAVYSEYAVSKFEDKMGGKADASLHAAQVVWYLTLQNRNKSSKDYGSYIWFGIGLWDNRSEGKTMPLYAANDGGTSAFIYSPSSTKYLTSSDGILPKVGHKAIARMDVLDVAKGAYDLAIERGYLGSTKYEDLYVGGTNFGFEVPGTYNIGVDISSIGVFYKGK